MPARTLSRKDYSIGIICTLDVEGLAAKALLDENHDAVQRRIGDENTYVFGKIGTHNVVIVCLPAGEMNSASAAAVATDLQRSFPIKIALMVGLCEDAKEAWSEQTNMSLESTVAGVHGGMVPWDLDKMLRNVVPSTHVLDDPQRPLLDAVQDLNARRSLKYNGAGTYDEIGLVGHQGAEHGGGTQSRRTYEGPRIDYGITQEDDAQSFETEATFPCLVIPGVCDYADSQKNAAWTAWLQGYAAEVAAATAKELILSMPAADVTTTHSKSEASGRCCSVASHPEHLIHD
jgi:hypothetical protein